MCKALSTWSLSPQSVRNCEVKVKVKVKVSDLQSKQIALIDFMSVRIVMKKSVNSFFESELNAKCDEQKTDIFCPGYLYLVELLVHVLWLL